ncbi:hypothetical protein ACFC8N_34565 [Streptomyces sp. NPDC055966]|uniref:hypothetical protein n=1 Tax=Streptomyces sp. NPDC055966 TaxID=3345669 RepID=UPI0035DE5915
MQAKPLSEFLRARRALVRPEDHGMPAGTRRTPGLRREEIALLAGVSTDYHVRLEQGHERNPSSQVLRALAAALLLKGEESAYLHTLVDPPQRGQVNVPAVDQGRRVDPGVQQRHQLRLPGSTARPV